MKLWLLYLSICLGVVACGGPRQVFPGSLGSVEAWPAPNEGGGSSDVGSAGDNAGPDHDAAWFVGRDRAIDVCYEVAPDFGVDQKNVAPLISAIFKTWGYYIHQHKVYELEWPHLQLSTDHVSVREGCDRKADLAVYLGVENDLVKKYRKQFLNPTAFVQRLSFEKLPPWGKGFIWVAKQGAIRAEPVFPNWSKPGTLSAILIHEIGHTYGNEHIPGTIMAADVSALLKTDNLQNLINIDRCRELVPCLSCFYLHHFQTETLSDSALAALKILLGRDPVGEGRVLLARTSSSEWGLMTIADKIGNVELNLPMPKIPAHSEISGLAVFKVAYGNYVNSIPDISFTQHSEVYSSDRKVAFADIDTNLAACTGDDRNDRTPVSLSLVENRALLPLFDFSTQIDVVHNTTSLFSPDIQPLPPRFP